MLTINHHDGPGFRADINALRALAVLMVVFFHYKVPQLDGGFIGVDVFFVISGYLMTRIIQTEIAAGRFSVREFYVRRLKRIVPALLALVVIVTIAGYWIYFPEDYKFSQKNALSSLFFISNFHYLTHNGYFDQASDLNVFLHTWSLSVEWQFYMLYPFLMLGLHKMIKLKRQQVWVFAVTIVALYVVAIVTTKYYRSASFYLLPTRGWEMLAGGAAFVCEGYFRRQPLNKVFALLGYGLIIGCALFLNHKVSWPGKFTAIPVAATFLILCAKVNAWQLLHVTPVQFFGKISYSLYLWHWPVGVMAHYLGVQPTLPAIVVMFILSTGLATLSFFYVETVRYSSGRKIVRTTTALGVAALLLACLNTNVWLFDEQALRLSSFAKTNQHASSRHFSFGTCFVSISGNVAGKQRFKKDSCMQLDGRKKNVLLIGDSHAAHFSESLREFFNNRNVNLMQATATDCFPFSIPNGNPDGYEVMRYVYHDFLVKHGDNVDGIIISAAWHNDSFQEMHTTLAHLNETLTYLGKFNKKVIVLGQSETYTIPFPTIHAKEIQYKLKLRHKYLEARTHHVHKTFKAQLPAHYVDLYNINTNQVLSKDGIPYMFDKDHYSKYGADVTIASLMQSPTFKNFVKGL